MNSSLWSYKAYDENFKIHNGTQESTNFLSLALELRQQGLQVLSAKKMGKEEIALANRLEVLKQRLDFKRPKQQSLIRRMLLKITSLFRSLFLNQRR